MSYFMGIDVSTTASKVLLINEKGEVVVSHSEPHALSTPYPLWSEQHPEDWWQATRVSIQKVLQHISAEEIACIGLTGQMHGLVTLDKQGKPVRPCILWNDQRSAKQCEEITALLGEKFLYQHIGGALIPCFIVPKLRWLQQYEPESYQRIEHILLPKDYIRFRLSQAYITDVADGSGLGLMDIAKRNWSEPILSALNIPKSWLPALYESTDICCAVTQAAAAETGLKVGTPIVGGAGDQPAQSIGCGIANVNRISMAVGTSGVTFSISNHYLPEPEGRLNTFCHAIPNTWFYMGVTMSAAGSLRWFKDEIAPHKTYQELDQLAASVKPGANGLLFLPYLSGERHPHADPLARGAWIGLTVRHGLAHMARAIMEGVAFSLRDTLQLLHQQGVKAEHIRLSGGAANSPLWQQIMADVMNLPMLLLDSNEGAAFGAAVMAAVGYGAWSNVQAACEDLVKINKIIEPISQHAEQYEKLYEVYRDLYPQLKNNFAQLEKFD